MRKREITICTDMNMLTEQRKHVLLSGCCPQIMQSEFFISDGQCYLSTETEGKMRISEIRNTSAEKVLDILIRTLSAMERAEEYLMFAGDYRVDTGHAFLDKTSGNVAFIYQKTDENVECFSEKHVIINLISQLKSITSDNGKYYLGLAEDYVHDISPGRAELTAFLNDLLMEIQQCCK